ncbi:MAG: class I SAM-dependent DNA methyltransferase [Ignavibacteriales bacterium]
MKVKPYEKVAEVYDGLMKKVDYQTWAKYLLVIAEENIPHNAKILELGAGNGKMAEIFLKKYKNYFVSDISLPMLKNSSNSHLRKICCDMSAIPITAKFDFIFSAFDGVNYILKQKSLFNLFSEVYRLLTDDGIFTFDVSLERNSMNITFSDFIEGNHNGFWFQKISKYNKHSRIHYNKFYISDETGFKYKEVHKEKIYKIDTYFRLAEKVGLYTEHCFDCFSFKDVSEKSYRAQFVMRKIN